MEDNINSKTGIIIYPNPSSGEFSIEGLGLGIYDVEIYNMVGEKVYSAPNINPLTSNEIYFNYQPNGIYFLQIKSEGKTISKKIIIQK